MRETRHNRPSLNILQSIVLHGWSAGSWYAVEFSKALTERGHNVTFLTPEGGITAQKALQAGLKVDTTVNLKERSPGAMRRNVQYMRELLRRERFDIVNAHWGEDHVYWAIILRFLAAQSAVLVRTRSVDHRAPKRHPFNKILNRKWTDLIIVSNDRLKAVCQSALGMGDGKVRTIYPGFDLKPFQRFSEQGRLRPALGFNPHTLIVGFIARFSPIKGHVHFFEAARQVAESIGNVMFLVVGHPSGLDRGDIQKLAHQCGVERNMVLVDGRMDHIQRLMEAVDVGVVSSIGSEAISRVILEYMAMGKPVVSVAVGGIPEIVVHSETGLLVPPKQPAAMAQAIVDLLRRKDRRRQMGAMGRKRVEALFSIEQRADEMEETLYEIWRERGYLDIKNG